MCSNYQFQLPIAVVMPSSIHTGYAHYPHVPDKVINEYATPIVLAYNGVHHYTATEWTTAPSDGPYVKLSRFIAQMDSALLNALNLIAQIQDHEFRHQMSHIAEEVAKLQAIFQQRQVRNKRSVLA